MIAPTPRDTPHLQQQLADAMRRSESLRQVIESISGELALEPLLTRIVASAVQLIGAMYGSIGLVVEEAGRSFVRTAAIYNMPSSELGAEMEHGVGLAGRVLAERQPLILDRYAQINQMTLPELANHAVIGMPIWWGERMIGFFGIGSEPPRRFTTNDSETLMLFARHAAVAIENARLFRAEQRRAARITTINRIGQLITSRLSLREVFQTAVDSIHTDLGFAYVAAGLVDPDDADMLVLYAQAGRHAANVPDGYRQSIHEGVVGAAARTKQRVWINDVRSDPRFLPIRGAEATRAELVLPILIETRLLGVLNIEADAPITEQDVEGVEIVADQLGVALDNAMRYSDEQRRTERLALIARVSQRIAARLDPDELFATTVEELHGRLGFDHVSLFLLDPDDPTMLVQRARASRWPRSVAAGYRQSIERGVMGAAARLRTHQLINDVTADPRYIAAPRANDLRAELAMPILLGERLLGILDIGGVRRFGEEDVQSLRIVADQLAVAVDNAQLFAATQHALTETQLLYETSQRINTTLGVDDVIVAYLEQVAARGRYACTLVLYEFGTAAERTAVIVRGRWTPHNGLDLREQRLPYTYDALDPPLDAGETITIVDVQTDPRVSAELRALQQRDQRPALAMIPLVARGQRIGLVVLSNPQIHAWPAADLRLYQATAAQLATAIDTRMQQQLLLARGQQVAVLEERQRLARELHDSVTQLIFSMTLIAQSIAPAWRRDPHEGEHRTHRLLELSQATLAEMRALLTELRPADTFGEASSTSTLTPELARVRRDGLAAALRQHLSSVAHDGLRIDLLAEHYRPQAYACEEALYRITQEALNNVVKHAQAQQVTIRLSTDENFVRLCIKDDGIGFALAASRQPVPQRGFGLHTMRERAEALGGTTNIHTDHGRGTMIEVVLPR